MSPKGGENHRVLRQESVWSVRMGSASGAMNGRVDRLDADAKAVGHLTCIARKPGILHLEYVPMES